MTKHQPQRRPRTLRRPHNQLWLYQQEQFLHPSPRPHQVMVLCDRQGSTSAHESASLSFHRAYRGQLGPAAAAVRATWSVTFYNSPTHHHPGLFPTMTAAVAPLPFPFPFPSLQPIRREKEHYHRRDSRGTVTSACRVSQQRALAGFLSASLRHSRGRAAQSEVPETEDK